MSKKKDSAEEIKSVKNENDIAPAIQSEEVNSPNGPKPEPLDEPKESLGPEEIPEPKNEFNVKQWAKQAHAFLSGLPSFAFVEHRNSDAAKALVNSFGK